MEKGGEATPSEGLYGERGGGGKLRKPPSRKPLTPYARPPKIEAERGQKRWLSSLIDPAYRLIAGGATRLLPSFFSKSNSISALPPPDVQLHDERQTETERNATGDEDNNALNSGISRTSEIAGPSQASDRLKIGSGFDGNKKSNLPDEIGLSEIEQLLEGKKFSRDEVNHLMKIIQSRAVGLPTVEHEKKNHIVTAAEKLKGPVYTDDFPKTLSEENHEDLNKASWETSTPVPQSAMRGEVGASPVDIARAYMGSKRSDIDLSLKNTMSKDERGILHGDGFSSKPFVSTPSKPSTCWPGSMVKDQRDYFTPQTERGRFGLHNFPRTPYSRTIFSKSKSKSTQLQRGNDKAPRTFSTAMQQFPTPIYGQPRTDALDGGYGSVGPIRRSRHKVAAQTPTRGSPYVHSSPIGTSQVENSNVSKGFLPATKKNFEPVGLIRKSQIQSLDRKPSRFSVPNVHPHSSQIARSILEQLDRRPATPKEKSEELKLAFAWRNPPSPVDQNGHDSSPLVGGFNSRKLVDQNYQKISAHENADKVDSLFKTPLQNPVNATDVVSNSLADDGRDGRSLVKSTHEDAQKFGLNAVSSEVPYQQKKPPSQSAGTYLCTKLQDAQKFGLNAVSSEVPYQQKKPPSQSAGTKRVFPSIAVDKPDSKWTVSSGNSSFGLTFPVSTASAVFAEPPTPSIMPSFVPASSQQQQGDGDSVPSYDFGSKKSAPLVFAFPSTSSEIQNGDSDIKFSIGSGKPRLSFSSIGKDAICY